MSKLDEKSDSEIAWWWIKRIGSALLILTLSLMWGCPNYRVYEQNLEGEAELARATQNRQIKIQEAQALKESAKDIAEAEVIRAHGVSRANKIIGESLKGNESYLRYLWIDKLDQNAGTVIYIPTEAGMPILEASRLNNKSPE